MGRASMQLNQSSSLPSPSPSPDDSRPLGYECISGRGVESSVCSTVSILPGGLRVKKLSKGIAPGFGGKRGKIFGFSDASQRRMTDWMMGIPWQSLGEGDTYFVSLTWHWNYTTRGEQPAPASEDGCLLTTRQSDVSGRAQPDRGLLLVDWTEKDPPRWHEQLKSFRKRLEREYGDRVQGAVWKKEFQDRGAPHYHLVVFFRPGRGPEFTVFARWVSAAWNDLVEPGDVANLYHGAKIQPVTNRSGSKMRALMRYLGKYMAKQFLGCVDLNGELLPVGRVWGIWGEVPEELLAEVSYGWNEHVQMVRRLRRWGKQSRYLSKLSPGRNGFRVFYDGVLLADLLEGLRPCD